MPKYEVEIADSQAAALIRLGESRKTSVPNLIRQLVTQGIEQLQTEWISDEFKRLVEESITENEPVLRRFAR